MRTDLHGRVAMVIGAEVPAGGAIALAFAEAGADVAVCAVQADERVLKSRKVKRAIEALGRRTAEYVMDVTLGRNVQVTTRQVAKEMGGLDIVVSAAELPLVGPLEKLSEMELAQVVALNFSSHLFAIRAAVAEFRRGREPGSGGGLVLLVTRQLAATGPEQTAYTAVQAASQQLAQGAATEFADRRVRVNALAVGGAGEGVAATALRLATCDDNGMVVAVDESSL